MPPFARNALEFELDTVWPAVTVPDTQVNPHQSHAEARYHYAPTKSVNTEFITVAFGIRY